MIHCSSISTYLRSLPPGMRNFRNHKKTRLIDSSGHGTQSEDLDGDEGDDDDEAICPVDYHENGLIVDDDSECLPLT